MLQNSLDTLPKTSAPILPKMDMTNFLRLDPEKRHSPINDNFFQSPLRQYLKATDGQSEDVSPVNPPGGRG